MVLSNFSQVRIEHRNFVAFANDLSGSQGGHDIVRCSNAHLKKGGNELIVFVELKQVLEPITHKFLKLMLHDSI